jgi:hypothetical protein
VHGEREKALRAIGERFGWPRLVADLDAICDVVADDAGLKYLRDASKGQFKLALAAWLGKVAADGSYPADALFALANQCREWAAKRTAKSRVADAPATPKPAPISAEEHARVAALAEAFAAKRGAA